MATTKRDSGGDMDAVTLLRKDHDDVNRMFDEFESADEDRKFELAADICQALTIHATIEEEIFYPRAREAIDAEDLMLEAEVEHDSVKYLVERVQATELDETELSAMIKVLKEYVSHHVNEEQRKMFPRVKRTRLDLQAIGRELMERKQELEAGMEDAASDAEPGEPDDVDAGKGPGRSRGGMAARDRDG